MADVPELLAVCLVGCDGIIVQCNPTLATWLGLPTEAIDSHPFRDRLPGIEELFEQVLHSCQRQCQAGAIAGRDVDMSADPLLEESGQVRSVLFLLADRAGTAARHGALEQQIQAPAVFEAPLPTSVTARLPGAPFLPESPPRDFAELRETFAGILDQAIQQREYRVSHPISEQLRALSARLGQLDAGPRDVVAVYRAALKERASGAASLKAQAYVEEGRLLALELMGHLVSYYRLRFLGMHDEAPASSPTGARMP